MCTWGYSQNTAYNLETNNIYILIKCWQIEDCLNSLCVLLKLLLGFKKKKKLNINWTCLPGVQLLAFIYKIAEWDSAYTQATKHPLRQTTQYLEDKILYQ